MDPLTTSTMLNTILQDEFFHLFPPSHYTVIFWHLLTTDMSESRWHIIMTRNKHRYLDIIRLGSSISTSNIKNSTQTNDVSYHLQIRTPYYKTNKNMFGWQNWRILISHFKAHRTSKNKFLILEGKKKSYKKIVTQSSK